MSRGFVKEEDQEDIPMVPPRADLPPGVTNYVTPKGMEVLLEEKEAMLAEKEAIHNEDEKERRIAKNHLDAKLRLLNDRIATAQIIEPAKQPQDEVRFGARVSLLIGKSKKPQQFQLVGVDEADIAKGKISFISPLARILIGKRIGDTAVLKLAAEERSFHITDIDYGTEATS